MKYSANRPVLLTLFIFWFGQAAPAQHTTVSGAHLSSEVIRMAVQNQHLDPFSGFEPEILAKLAQAQPKVAIAAPFPLSKDPLTPAGSALGALQVAPGMWWVQNPQLATQLGISKEQQKKMDEIVQQYRLKLIDLNAALAKEETILEPLLEAEVLDEAKILTQIDRVAQARAELEKANARMLLAIRQSLTQEQWDKLGQHGPKKTKNLWIEGPGWRVQEKR